MFFKKNVKEEDNMWVSGILFISVVEKTVLNIVHIDFHAF